MTAIDPGSSVSTVKRAIYDGLTAAFAGTVSVCYRVPQDAAELRADNGEFAAVWFGTEHTVDLSVDIFAGGRYNFDERYELPMTLEVFEDPQDPELTSLTPDQRQMRVDERLDEALGVILQWIADQQNTPTTAGEAELVHVFYAVAGGGARRAGFDDLVVGGYGAGQDFTIDIHARKVPS